MADKKINIRIGTSADLRAMKSVSTEAALMAKNVQSANVDLRQAILKTAADYESIAAKADKAARGMGTGYKTLGDFLRDIRKDTSEAEKGLATIRARIQAVESAAKEARAAREAKRLGDNADDAAKRVGGLTGTMRMLTQNTGFFGKALTAAFGGGIFMAAAVGFRALFNLAKKSFDDQMEEAKEAEKKSIESIDAVADRLSKYKSSVAEVGEAVRKAADTALAARQKEIDLTERLTKANIELARQKRIAAGEDAASVDAAANSQVSALEGTSARDRADAEILAAQEKLDATIKEHEDAVAETNRLKDARQALGESWDRASSDPEALKAGRKLRRELTSKIDEARTVEVGAYDRIKEAQKALDDAQKRRAALDTELEADELKAANERAASEAESARKAAEERKKAELAAAQDAAKERERLERELHQQRMADLRAELAAQKEAASSLQATATAAQSEFERAFAMYRDPERAAAEIEEERSRAADLNRLHKDASRYGGKWRIDELSALMAAGDSQGVSDALAGWRKSRSFTPEVEAMVRASAAEQTKTTAEDELRKLNEKTGELTQKLETLAQSRDGKLDGIERNTNQLANKLDELLTVKG